MNFNNFTRNRTEHGVTLIEAVVAMTVFAILALMAYPIFFNALQALQLNKATTAATQTATALVEQLRAEPNCDTLATIQEKDTSYSSNGINYSVELESRTPCIAGTVIELEIDSTRDSDNTQLFEQTVQVFIYPETGRM